jgi:hypothetical protein
MSESAKHTLKTLAKNHLIVAILLYFCSCDKSLNFKTFFTYFCLTQFKILCRTIVDLFSTYCRAFVEVLSNYCQSMFFDQKRGRHFAMKKSDVLRFIGARKDEFDVTV